MTASTIFASGISFLYSVLAKRYVDPLDYGIYSTCVLLQTYLAYSQLGVLNAYNRDLPQLIGARKMEDARKTRDTSISFIWLMYVAVCLVTMVVLTIIRLSNGLSDKYYFGYMLAMVYLIVDTTATFCMNTTRIYGDFNYSAMVNIVKTLIALTMGLIGIFLFGYYGLYLMPISGGIASIVLYYSRSLKGIHLHIDRPVLKDAMWSGIPLMLNTFVWTIMGSVDKFVILIFMTTTDLGIYTVPLMGFTTMVLIPQTISQVFYYKISIAYGESGDEKQLVALCNKFTRVTTLCTGAVAVLAYYILPIFVELVMPMYTDGIYPAQILLVGVAIYGTTMLYGNIFSVMKWNRDLIVNSVILCIFNIIFSTGMVLILGRDIENVALGTAISYTLYSFLLLKRLSNRFEMSLGGFLQSSWLPMLLIMVPALLLYYLLPNIYLAFAVTCVILGLQTIFIYRGYKK